ncbi:MAG: hypothetical protein ACLPQS_01755 [Acidimicrobiales bacterium]
MATERRAPSPPPPGPPGTHEEVPDRARALAVTLVAVVLAVIVLVALPKQTTAGQPAASTSTTTTTAPHHSTTSTSSTPTTTNAGAAIHVAVLAPTGSPDDSTVVAKLTAARDILPAESPIPSSWVSDLTSPLIRYPVGLLAQANRVAVTLGVPESAVTAEPPGSSYGANVVEVFLPAT